MTDETTTVETMTNDSSANPHVAAEETTDVETTASHEETTADNIEQAPVDDPKARAREFYRKRQERKIEEAAAKAMEQQKQELQERIESGEIPHDEVMGDVLQEKEKQLREYQLKDFVTENADYAPHKDAIAQAMQEQRYVNLSIEEVANIVAAKHVMELQTQNRKAAATSTTMGSSARHANNEVDYRTMSGDELERRIAAAKFKS